MLTVSVGSALTAGPLIWYCDSTCSFAEKAFRVQEAGAVAAIIYDSDPDNDSHWIDMIVEGLDFIVDVCCAV